jgi:hypothetical protein
MAQGQWEEKYVAKLPQGRTLREFLVQVNGDGTFTVVVDGLILPTSLEFIDNTAYVSLLVENRFYARIFQKWRFLPS